MRFKSFNISHCETYILIAATLAFGALARAAEPLCHIDEDESSSVHVTALVRMPGLGFTPEERLRVRCVVLSGPAFDQDGKLIGTSSPTDKDLEVLGTFKSLERVLLYGDTISVVGIEGLGKCKTLKEYLHSKMKNARELIPALCKECPNLEILEIAGSDLSDNEAAAVISLKHLKFLNISNTDITSKFFQAGQFSKRLTHLSLRSTNVDDTVIASIPSSVTHLKLSDTKVTAAAMDDLAKRKGLKYLTLPGSFPHDKVEQLEEALPDTKINKSPFTTY